MPVSRLAPLTVPPDAPELALLVAEINGHLDAIWTALTEIEARLAALEVV